MMVCSKYGSEIKIFVMNRTNVYFIAAIEVTNTNSHKWLDGYRNVLLERRVDMFRKPDG